MWVKHLSLSELAFPAQPMGRRSSPAQPLRQPGTEARVHDVHSGSQWGRPLLRRLVVECELLVGE